MVGHSLLLADCCPTVYTYNALLTSDCTCVRATTFKQHCYPAPWLFDGLTL